MVDIIVTTYNRLPLLKRTMESFFKNTPPVNKIIIANDGSDDGTAEYLKTLKKKHPNITVLPDQEKRLGLIPRFNAALEETESDIVCEFQDDVEFSPGWLESQLNHIDDAHFITGVDAVEHRDFGRKDGYKIKHSSRFTQLTAKRSTWNRWFPMTPRHEFPTPCLRNGARIGSGIDMALSGFKKNFRPCKTRFLVIPSIMHIAERYNSTWRGDISEFNKLVPGGSGGLDKDTVRDYWKDRFIAQSAVAVGFAGKPEDEQKAIIREKREFIRSSIDTGLRTIDYGCGIGLFSDLFNKNKYLGLDITAEFLEIAKNTNPKHRYECLDDPCAWSSDFDFQQFMTINVLQHNNDYIVAEIFRHLKALKSEGLRIVLYENTESLGNTGHMSFRSPEIYYGFVADHYTIKSKQENSHIVHGQKHTIMVIDV